MVKITGMNINKKINCIRIRIAACIIMCTAMVLVSEITGEKEILFPEIMALVTGAWAAEKQPWRTNKFQIILLMTISSSAGVILVRYIQIPLYFKIIAGYIFVGFCLSLFASGLAPMISACILPVLMGTESPVYPISVFIMAVMIASGQLVMEKTGMRSSATYIPAEKTAGEWIRYWLSRAALLAVLAVLPIMLKQPFFIAPPLIVLFTEFSEPESPLRNIPFRIWAVTAGAAFTGSITRLLLCCRLEVPAAAAAFITICSVFFIFRAAGKMFPPAGAISLLPFIIPEESLPIFGFEVAAGAAVLMFSAMKIFKK